MLWAYLGYSRCEFVVVAMGRGSISGTDAEKRDIGYIQNVEL